MAPSCKTRPSSFSPTLTPARTNQIVSNVETGCARNPGAHRLAVLKGFCLQLFVEQQNKSQSLSTTENDQSFSLSRLISSQRVSTWLPTLGLGNQTIHRPSQQPPVADSSIGKAGWFQRFQADQRSAEPSHHQVASELLRL